MMNNQIKNKIRHKFNRAAQTYDQYCSVQNIISQDALQLLKHYKKTFDHIADFACGTGESTQRLLEHINFKHGYAVDIADQLLTVAQRKLAHTNNIHWIQADFDQPLDITKPLDLIFCNMGLQWSSNVSQSIHLWQTYLDDQGLILFSIPMRNNFPELREHCKPLFSNHEQIMALVSANNCEVLEYKTNLHKLEFSSQYEALKALKATGTNHNKSLSQHTQGLSPMKLNQIFIHPNIHHLTYEIGIYLVRKKP